MRDVMFYLEAQNKVEHSHLKEDIQQGEVVIPQNSTASNDAAQAPSRNHHRRKKSGR